MDSAKADDYEAETRYIISRIWRLQGEIDIKSKGDAKNGTPPDPEFVSASLVTLARLNSSLGKKAAFCRYVARNSKRAFEALKEEKDTKRSEVTLEKSENNAVGKSEHMAKAEVGKEYAAKLKEAFDTYSDVELLADEAEDLAFKTDTFMKMAQSRQVTIRGDISRG